MKEGMTQDSGASASRPGSREPSPSVSAASGFDPSRDELDEKTPYQIAQMMAALSTFIAEWSKVVTSAEDRARRDRGLLAGAMAELTRLSHYVARKGAMALEGASDSDGGGQ